MMVYRVRIIEIKDNKKKIVITKLLILMSIICFIHKINLIIFFEDNHRKYHFFLK